MKLIQVISRIKKALRENEKGSALVIALVIMLALTLLGLSLLLQSNTEYVISVNERDATAALANAEAVLQLAKEKIRNASSGASDLNDVLNGPDNADPVDDHFIGLRTTLTPTLRANDFTSDCSAGSTTCELTFSGIDTYQGQQYEVLRVGNGTGTWSGPRGLVYVRVDDNFDDAPAANNDLIDIDKRVTVTVISKYPIQVKSDGTYAGESKTAILRTAAVSTREIFARFGPGSTQAAIVSERNMLINGNLTVCGECGSIHADLDLVLEDGNICQNATETKDDPVVDPSATVGGDVGNSGFIDVPTANPFNPEFGPEQPEWFDTVTDPEYAGFPALQCDYDATTNHDVSKFFALVADGGEGLVYKAYWKPSPGRWEWKEIDDLNDNDNTILDECGRVWSGSIGPNPLSQDQGVDSSRLVNDNDNKKFYTFFLHHAGNDKACDENLDATLGPSSAENDYIENSWFSDPLNNLNLPSGVILPGTYGSDGDDDYEAGLCADKNDRMWKSDSSDVYAPVYNAVIYITSNLTITGNLKNICTHSGCTGLLNNIWRVTFLTLGSIDAAGNPRYAPARSFDILPNNQYLMVAGRDIEISGTPGEGDICATACEDPPVNLAGYAGILLAHEQISLVGNVTINGTVKAEDAAQCSNLVIGEGIQATGSVEVYYDCEHPPDTSGESVRMTSWEEVQSP
jgi:Tfp pilus assembly protein PilX